MTKFYVGLMDSISHFGDEQSGQDAFEYLLVIGGISVAIILGVATPVGTSVINKILTGTCAAIATIPTMSGVSC